MAFAGEVGNGYAILFEAHRKIYEGKGLQKIEIYDTKFGKMLVIDGCIQLIGAFEHTYHEMLVHVPMMTHPSPKRVLIIGGGDGGALREVLKHDPERVVMVEIDREVIDVCRKYLKIDDGAFEDCRVELRIEDGIEYVRECAKRGEKFDVLIVDGTDPSPTSMSLFSREFYTLCSRISDVFCTQSQSPALQRREFIAVVRNADVFERRAIYLSCIPMYPGGLWSFLIAGSIVRVSREELRSRFRKLQGKVKHYNPAVHITSFALPGWVKEMLPVQLVF